MNAQQPQQEGDGTTRRRQDAVASVGWVQWLRELIAAPLHFFQTSMNNVLLFFYVLFLNPQRQVLDPRGDVRRFIDSLSEKYEQHSMIPWLTGSFDEACRAAKATSTS